MQAEPSVLETEETLNENHNKKLEYYESVEEVPKQAPNSSKYHIRILYLIIRSVNRKGKSEELEYLLHILHKVDLVLLAETWINEDEQYLGLAGFTIVNVNRTEGSGGSIAMFMGNNIYSTSLSNVKCPQ